MGTTMYSQKTFKKRKKKREWPIHNYVLSRDFQKKERKQMRVANTQLCTLKRLSKKGRKNESGQYTTMYSQETFKKRKKTNESGQYTTMYSQETFKKKKEKK